MAPFIEIWDCLTAFSMQSRLQDHWSRLDRAGQGWSGANALLWALRVGGLDRACQGCAGLVWAGQDWPGLYRACQIWSGLDRAGQGWPGLIWRVIFAYEVNCNVLHTLLRTAGHL